MYKCKNLFCIRLMMASIFFLFPLSLTLLPAVHAEDVRVSTYYPSPYGNYKQVQIQEASSPTLTDYTQAVTKAGIDIITNYTAANYTPGVFWSTSDNFAAMPKAGIWMQENANGSTLMFGTSNAYNRGITNNGLVLDADGDVGIGTTNPTYRLHLELGAAGGQAALFSNYFATGNPTTLVLNHSRGTVAAPGYLVAGDGIGSIEFSGSDSTNGGIFPGARIKANVLTSNPWAAGSYPTSLFFQTTANGSNTPADRMTIYANGNVGVGITNPATRLHAEVDDAVTAAVTDILQLTHTTTGTAANSFGTGLLFSGETTQGGANYYDMGRIQTIWTDATHAERASAMQFQTMTTPGILTTQMNIDGDGNVGIGTTNNFSSVGPPPAVTPLHVLRTLNDAFVAIKLQDDSTGANSAARIYAQQKMAPDNNLSIAMDAYSPSLAATAMGADAPGNTAIVTLSTFARLSGANQGNLFLASRGGLQRIAFYTGGTLLNSTTERMRITQDALGNTHVGIGTTSPTHMFDVNGTAGKPGAGSWLSFSDLRMKKDISPYTDGLGLISQIDPIRFKYNGLGPYKDSGIEYVGVAGQKMKKIAPYMIETVRAKLHPTDTYDTELLQFDPSALTYALINAVKELKTENDTLKKETQALKKRVEALEKK